MARILCAGIEELNKEKFDRFDNHSFETMNKPGGFLWGSTMTPNEYHLSDWLRWCFDEDFHVDTYQKAVSFTLKKKSKIATIDTLEDYRNLMKNYSKWAYPDEMKYKYNRLVINWDKLSKDYDAFHLTEDAFWSMRLPWDPDELTDVDGNYLENFYSYDCETWIIFNLECINEGSILNHSTGLKSWDIG